MEVIGEAVVILDARKRVIMNGPLFQREAAV